MKRTLMVMTAGMALSLSLVSTATSRVRTADPPLTVSQQKLAGALKCPPRFTHSGREAVLLVHGTGLTAEQSWSWNYSRALPQEGFDTCTVTLPDQALGDIQVASQYVVYAIERIAARTGRRVDVITHSQGGMEARWTVRWWPTVRAEVDDLVLLASPNHGIYAADVCAASGSCWPAVWQMAEQARFLSALNAGSETPGRVSYTDVYSLTDELVEPSSTVPLRGGANTSNLAIQSICPGRVVHHAGLLEDAVAGAIVMDALTHPGPADTARIDPTTCLGAFMPYVGAQEALAGNVTLYGNAAQAFAGHSGVASEPPPASYARAGRP